MHRKYNIYDQMLRAAAGEGTPGADDADPAETVVVDDASATANAKTINADDPDEPIVVAKVDEPAADPAAAADDAPDPAADPALKPAMVPRDVMLKRVGELTRDKKANAEALAAKDAEIARLKAAKSDDGEADPADGAPARSEFKTQAEFDDAVRKEAAKVAREQVETNRFNERCNAVADAGEKDYKTEWNDSVANLRMLSDDGNIPKLLLDAALEADDPAAALHHLGQHPEEAMRILSLPPLQQVASVVKHGIKKAAPKPAPKPRTNAPDPVDPLNGSGEVDVNEGLGDTVDDATWLRNRQAEVRAKALAAAGRGGTSH